jgi:hypothetical protein
LDVGFISLKLPSSGLDISSAAVTSPESGLDIESVVSQEPASGLDISSAAKLTLNIDIEPSQSFADDPSSGVAGEIRYASGYLYIHDGTNWHHINGA